MAWLVGFFFCEKVMRTLMERLARAPPGYGVFVENAGSSISGGGDALALAGAGSGAAKKLEWETWPQEEDTGHTAWHKVCHIREIEMCMKTSTASKKE